MKTKLLFLTILLTTFMYGQTPGGVATTNMKLWFSGDASITDPGTFNWGDRSGNGFDAYQSDAAAKPIQTDLFNYNETLTFDGLSDKPASGIKGDYLAIKGLNYAAPANISDIYAFVIYKTAFSGANFNSNWALLDFDRGNAYSLYVQGNGRLGMSYPLGTSIVSDNFGTTKTNNDVPHMGTFIFDNNFFTKETKIKVNGKIEVDKDNTTNNISINGTRYGFIGDGSEAAAENGARNNIYYDGEIAEVILFDKTVQPADVLRIESYLALKYGINLDASNGFYKDSKNNTLWDNTLPDYWNNVAGLIKDDVTGSINQKIATSVNSKLIVATNNDYVSSNNSGSRTPLANDGDYLLFGSTNYLEDSYEEFDGSSSTLISKRKWLFREGANDTGNIYLAMPIDFFPPSPSSVQLIISKDDTFTSADTMISPTVNGSYYEWNVNIANLDRVSFVISSIGKKIAGILPTRFELVLAADQNLTTGSNLAWEDLGSYKTNGFQNFTGAIPNSTNLMNFNKTLEFDGDNDFIALKDKNYKEKTQIKKLHSFIIFKTKYNTPGTGFGPNFSNWALLDFDRSEAYNMFIRPDGRLAFSYQSGGTRDIFSTSEGNNFLPHIGEFIFDGDKTFETLMKFDGRIEYEDDLTFNDIVVKAANEGLPTRYGFIGDGSEADLENGSTVTGVAGTGGTGRNNINYEGQIAEVIMTDREGFSPIETVKIESYLAIKYGITLNNGTNGDRAKSPSLITEYLNSAGTVIWDSQEYWHGIAGLIKDNVDSNLNQTVAESESSPEKDIVVSTNLDFVSPNRGSGRPELNEGQSLIFGNNNLTKGQVPYSGAGVTSLPNYISLRKWLFKEVGGSTADVYIGVRKSFIEADASSVRMVISKDDVFTGTGDDVVVPMIENGDFYYYKYDVKDGDRIGIVYEVPVVQSPGGINTGLTMWDKADKGVISTVSNQVQSIADSWITGNGASQTVERDSPSNSISLNYNPNIAFDGVHDHLNIQNLNYNTPGAIPKLYSWVIYQTDFTGADNSSFYDFDKDEYYNTSIDADGKLNFSYSTTGGTFINKGTTAGTNDGTAKLGGFVFDTSLTEETAIRLNGAVDFKGSVTSTAIGTGTPRFGFIGDASKSSVFGDSNTEDFYKGNIAEIVHYEGETLSSVDIHKIESYLAFKYAISLDSSLGGTAGDYIDSNETIIWDASNPANPSLDNTDYNEYIAGIGRDDDSALYQKQAISSSKSGALTVSLGEVAVSNKENTGVIAVDKNYFMWGVKPTGVLSDELPIFRIDCSSDILKVNRDWKVQKTGDVGLVTLQFNMKDFYRPDHFHLLIDRDNDGDFTTGSPQKVATGVLSGDLLTFKNVNLSNGNVFTLERKGSYDIRYNGSWSGGNGIANGPNLNVNLLYKRVIVENSVTALERFHCECLKVNSGQKLTIPSNMFVQTSEVILDGDLYLEGTAELNQQKRSFDSNSGAGNVYKILGEATESLYRYNYLTSPVHTFATDNFTLANNMKINNGATLGDNRDNIFTSSLDEPGETSRRWIHTLNNGDNFVEIDENTPMSKGIGFTMKGSDRANKYNFIGKPNNGKITLPITVGKTLLTGNPYPSSIDAQDFNAFNKSVIGNTIYLWDQPNGDVHFPANEDDSGGYATIIDGYDVGPATFKDETTPVPGRTTPRRFIKPGQGFIVYGISTGDVVFKNSMRVKNSEYRADRHFFKTKELETVVPSIRLGFEYTTDDKKLYHRQIATIIEDVKEEEVSSVVKDVTAEDLRQVPEEEEILGKNAFMFDVFNNDAYWVLPNQADRFVITTSPAITDNLELPVGVVVDQEREVTFKLDDSEGIFGEIYLFDKQEDKITNIRKSAYTSVVNVGDFRERFSVVFKENAALNKDEVLDNIKTIISVSKRQLKVILEKGLIDRIELYNLAGQNVTNYIESDQTNSATVNLSGLASNIYIVKIVTNINTITKKVIVD